MQEKIVTVKDKIARAAVKSGRKPESITLVAVSKTVGFEEVRQAVDFGLGEFGENRTRELLLKANRFPLLRWHMIGRLQTNKVKEVVGVSCLIHSVDRWSLAQEISRRGVLINASVDVLLQVNIAGEKQKGGLLPGEVETFLSSAGELSNMQIKGFMTMAPELDNPEKARPVFRELRILQQKLQSKKFSKVSLEWLSMGMSQDYEVAIEEGSNMVRIGSAIFH